MVTVKVVTLLWTLRWGLRLLLLLLLLLLLEVTKALEVLVLLPRLVLRADYFYEAALCVCVYVFG